MRTIKQNAPLLSFMNNGRNHQDEFIRKEKFELNMKVFSIFYLAVILILCFFVILEVKHEYNIDLIPGFNTPFDDVYFDVKNSF